ncbi:MAG: hypothetical protein SVZ03_06580 [Spirochaetota bacterium]|nr:hypothetical protein [Spirochaetota bacterium]
MKLKNKLLLQSLLILYIITTFTNMGYTNAQATDIVVIVNKSQPSLTQGQILMIFTGFKDRWPNGDRIKVLINRDSNIKEAFCSQKLNMTVNKLYNFWLKKQSRSGGSLPEELSSERIIQLVAGNPKYIGFIKRSELIASVREVK